MKHDPAEGRELTGRSAMTNASYVAAAEVVAKLSTLAWTVVAAQQLGQEGYGAFNLALAVGLMLTAFGKWGFNSIFVRRGSRDTSRLSQFFTEVVTWQVGLATPMIVLGTAVFAVLTPSTVRVTAFTMVLLAVLVDMVSDTARAASSTLHRQGTTSAALIVQRLMTAAVAIPATVIWGSVLALAVAFLASALLGVVLHGIALRRLGIGFEPHLLTVRGLQQSLSGTHFVGLSGVVQEIQNRAGFILLGALVGQRAVGSYSAAYRLFETVLFLSFALVAAVFPLMSTERTRAGLRQLTEASVGLLTGLYLPFAVICLVEAPRLVELVFGAAYVSDTSGPLRWFAAAPLLFAVSYVGGTALVAVSRTRFVLVSASAATATCVTLALLLIPRYEAVGAAIALTAAFGVDAILSTVFLRRALGQWPRYLREAAQPAFCSLLVLAVLWLLDASFLVELSISALVYVVCWGSLLWWTRSGAARLVQSIPGSDESTDHQFVQPEERHGLASGGHASEPFDTPSGR